MKSRYRQESVWLSLIPPQHLLPVAILKADAEQTDPLRIFTILPQFPIRSVHTLGQSIDRKIGIDFSESMMRSVGEMDRYVF